jgi:adenylosuccinate synthase
MKRKNKMLDGFLQRGKASFVLGGQFGSCGKGAAVAWAVQELAKTGRSFDIVTSNNGSQSGHTSIHDGKKRILFHLPTAPFMDTRSGVYLNAGAVIDVDVLMKELADNPDFDPTRLMIHPRAAIITQECKDAEQSNDSAQTKIASTRKGVGEALARKVLRSGMIAKDHPALSRFIFHLDLNDEMRKGSSVLVEVPQGVSLSLNASPFYPHTTSRDCTVAQAMSDAGIHPHFVGQTMLVLRTFPIRVGAIQLLEDTGMGHKTVTHNSGGVYPDQHEISFADLGVEAEITTVTKRVRRIFTWSDQQVVDAIRISRPSVIFLSFCDYLKGNAHWSDMDVANELAARIRTFARNEGLGNIEVVTAFGPTTADVCENLSR